MTPISPDPQTRQDRDPSPGRIQPATQQEHKRGLMQPLFPNLEAGLA